MRSLCWVSYRSESADWNASADSSRIARRRLHQVINLPQIRLMRFEPFNDRFRQLIWLQRVPTADNDDAPSSAGPPEMTGHRQPARRLRGVEVHGNLLSLSYEFGYLHGSPTQFLHDAHLAIRAAPWRTTLIPSAPKRLDLMLYRASRQAMPWSYRPGRA